MIKKEKYALLEFKNITVMKGENKKVLDSLSITIPVGENAAILGANGAGKSSFIKTITREYYPLAGRRGSVYRIWGEEHWNVFDLRYLLGIVSNDLQYAYTRDITGMDVVLSGFFGSIGLYTQRITSTMKKASQSVLEFLEIDHLKERRMNTLSTGEARRFLIARALVHKPKALILDEPANSLDLHAAHALSNILRKIAKAGTSIILVTQNIDEIIPEISRVVLMKAGRIYKDSLKEKILTSPTISRFFHVPVTIVARDGYYYVFRG